MAPVKCSHCGAEVVTEVGQVFETYPESKKKIFYSKEIRQIEITHKRDFHHPAGYVWETWSASLCEECVPKVIARIGFMEYWID